MFRCVGGRECFVNFFKAVKHRIRLNIVFQMKPTSCTVLLNVFISTSLHVLDSNVPILRRIYCIYATWYLFSLYGCILDSHPHRVKKYHCRIYTVNSIDDGHIVARNMSRSWNNYTKKYCATSWLYLRKKLYGNASSTKHKIRLNIIATLSLSLSLSLSLTISPSERPLIIFVYRAPKNDTGSTENCRDFECRSMSCAVKA